MKKKVLVSALTMAMVLDSSFSTFAAGSIDDMTKAAAGQDVVGDSTVQEPVIDVDVPTDANFAINPFGVVYTDTSVTPSVTSDAVIYSPVRQIQSNSNVDIAVNVSELKAESSTVTMASKDITAKDTAKSVFLYMDMVVSGEGVLADQYDSRSSNQLVIPQVGGSDSKAKPASKSNAALLKANDDTNANDDSFALFKISGSAVANPTKTNSDKTITNDPWSTSDAVKVTIKFTFTPQPKNANAN
ncbi:MAG: hypothetical protein HFI75_05645 [Lachnospiraceae bacterium]|nr:hypothetical protein [Lachnospiraceae bacterium]